MARKKKEPKVELTPQDAAVALQYLTSERLTVKGNEVQGLYAVTVRLSQAIRATQE